MSPPVPPWQQRAARGRAASQPLSLDAIVRTALDLLNGEGLGAVSMRRLAQQFGTGAASLYAHVRNKDELHALMLDLVLGEVFLPEPDPGRWQEQVKELVRDQLRVFGAHPGIAQVLMRTSARAGPNALAVTEAMLALLRSAGLPDRTVAFAVDLLALYPTAVAVERSTGSGLADDEKGERAPRVRQYFASLPADRFPNLVAMRGALPAGDEDERFEFGLDLIVQGLAARIP